MSKKMSHEISDQITDDKIIRKMGVISDTFNDLKSSLRIGNGLQLCDSTLLLAVRSYFYDVLRYKYFHNTPLIDGNKQAAFLVKWILKMRPVHIGKGHKPTTLIEHFGNEVLALKLALMLIRVSEKQICDDLFSLIIYTFKFRKIHEDLLILWFTTLSLTLGQSKSGS